MAALELYGKCKELGYCDCGGFFGCVDQDHVGGPVAPDELAAARQAVKAEAMVEGHRKYAANEPLVALVECEICDRSHAPNHPHITKIEGDEPLDDEPAPTIKAEPSPSMPPLGGLPDWLQDKPGSQVIRPRTSAQDQVDPAKLCQVCGEPWAPRHACKGAKADGTAFNGHAKSYATKRNAPKCDECGKIKRSNHKCKGLPKAAPAEQKTVECKYCKASGELCVRHGGVWSDYDVRAYGAVGDGVTDDSAAIQSAIEAASATLNGAIRKGTCR
jgi:Pectate lyase superfamily protein